MSGNHVPEIVDSTIAVTIARRCPEPTSSLGFDFAKTLQAYIRRNLFPTHAIFYKFAKTYVFDKEIA